MEDVKENITTNSNRNYYIDFMRGLAIISVILIHTAWHSGTKYVPEIVRNLTLLYEVPAFFFIAGWTYTYIKSDDKYLKGLLKLQIRYSLYMLIVFVLILISQKGTANIQNLWNWIFHNYSSTYPLQSVQYSLWFMKTYFITVLCSISIIRFCKKKTLIICYILLILIVLQTININNFNKIIIGLNVSLNYIIFYTFMFLLGYNLKDCKIGIKKFFMLTIANIICLVIMKFLFKFDIMNIQTNKYNTNLVYLLWSMFGIYIIVFLKQYLINFKKDNIFVKLGQNSIYLYFAQGISSSLLYFISGYIKINWYFKLPCMFIINLIMAVTIMIILKFIIELIMNIPRYLYRIKELRGKRYEKNF